MRLTDFLQDVGRPVAYYPSLRKITGSTNATILLCQFMYWRGKESGGDGWLYKQSDEIEAETGLSYDEQTTARKKLVDAGLLEEYYARLDHQMKFRLNLDAINEKWGNLQSQIPESRITGMGKTEKADSLNESESTTENMGAKAPNTADMPIDWQLSHDAPVVQKDQFEATARDMANLLDMGCHGGGELALVFMMTRKILIPESKIKGNRKAAREMLQMGVKSPHVIQAVEDLTRKGMTITDLFSVSKTAIDLANKPEVYNPNKEFGLI